MPPYNDVDWPAQKSHESRVDRRLAFPGAVDIRVMPSIDTPRRCLVFVHGFGGNAIGTWVRFNALLPSHPTVALTDLIYYGYDGINVDVVASAGILRQFLSRLVTDPELIGAALPADARKDFQRDEQIVLVAHSLGGVVARYAILDALEPDDPWVDHAEILVEKHIERLKSAISVCAESISHPPYATAY